MLRRAHGALGLSGLPRAGRAPTAPPAPEQVAADLPRVHGAWPALRAVRLAVFVACDAVYLREHFDFSARSAEFQRLFRTSISFSS